MAKITFENKQYELESDESVLLGLKRHGVTLPSSCESGVCQTCMLLAVKGDVPATAQSGLKSTLQKQNYFLACVCQPSVDLEIAIPGEDVKPVINTQVVEKTFLSRDVFRLRLRGASPMDYYPGQFISLYHPNGITRSYSIASLPSDGALELHIRVLPNGQMTNWLKEQVDVGDTIKIGAATGDCFYLDDNPKQNLLLIGTGTGLSPLLGIIRDALQKGHEANIHLYHGSQSRDGLYLDAELKTLAKTHSNFHYTPCISGDEAHDSATAGRANDVALKAQPDLKDWKVYLCGNPDMVSATKRKAFLAGASLSNIFSDPFIINDSAT